MHAIAKSLSGMLLYSSD